MWYVNTEIVFPLFKEQGVSGAIFYDAGNSLAEDEEWTFEEVAQGVGVELRWFSPMGPLRVVYGYNPDPRPDEPSSVWDFSVGGQF